MMTIYKNDPNYEISYTSKLHTFITVGNVKIRKNNKTQNHIFFEFLINQVKSGVKSAYDRGYRGNLHQFQCYTM